MPSESRPPAVDLLVVGALTIDRRPGGGSAPGGTVLHAARVAAANGLSVVVVTQAGSESEAQDGLRELARLGAVHAEGVAYSAAFVHAEAGGARELTLQAPTAPLSSSVPLRTPRVLLYGPVGAEYGADLGGQIHDRASHAAILQGWLRTLDPGSPIRPRPLDALDPELVERLASFDLLVASDEDLALAGSGPQQQITALRAAFGGHPVLAVTEGVRGAWLDAGGARLHVAPAPVVSGVPTIGAGDGFAAILAVGIARRLPLREAGSRAAAAVVAYLQERLRAASP